MPRPLQDDQRPDEAKITVSLAGATFAASDSVTGTMAVTGNPAAGASDRVRLWDG